MYYCSNYIDWLFGIITIGINSKRKNSSLSIDRVIGDN